MASVGICRCELVCARRVGRNLYLARNGGRDFSSGQDEYLVRLNGTR